VSKTQQRKVNLKAKPKQKKDLNSRDLNYILLLSVASISTVFLVLSFLVQSQYRELLLSVFLPLTVYSWPPAIHRLSKRTWTFEELMERLVVSSKVLESPASWSKETVNNTLYGYMGAAVIGLALYYLMGSYLYSPLGGLLVLFTYFLPWLRTFDNRTSLQRRVEMELPIISLMMWGLSEIGYDVMRMVETLKEETEALKAIPRELAKIYRDFTVFNLPPDQAVLKETEDHPSKLFERLLGGAVIISSIGGEISVHLSRVTTEVLQWLKESWDRYGRSVSNLGELSLLFLLMIPLLAIWFAIVQGNVQYGTDMIVYFLVPLIGVSLYIYVAFQAPLDTVPVKGNPKLGGVGLAVGIIVDVIYYLITKSLPMWLAVLIPTAAFSLLYGYRVQRALVRKSEVESKMALLVRAVGEHVRTTGDNLYTALSKLKGNKNFGGELNRIIERYLLLSAVSDTPVPEMDSWVGKSIFEIMVKTDKEGVLRYEILRKLSEFADSYYDAVSTKRRSLYMFLGSSIAAPVILVAMIALTFLIMNSIAGLANVPPLQQTPGVQFPPQLQGFLQFFSVFQNIGQIIQGTIPAMELAIVEIGIIYGLLLAKGYDGTNQNTFRIFQQLMVSGVSVLLLHFVITHISLSV